MEFSMEQKWQIDNNVNGVSAYIFENIVPQIHKPIRIDFGKPYTGSRGSVTTDFHLKVCPKKEVFTDGFGGNAHEGYTGISRYFGAPEEVHVVDYSSKYALLENWKAIKQALLAEVNNQKRELKTREQTINNFKI